MNSSYRVGSRFQKRLGPLSYFLLGQAVFWLVAGPLAGQPANDDFADRVTLTGSNLVVTGSNVGATVEAGEPVDGSVTAPPIQQTVWWTWSAPASGVLAVTSEATEFPHAVRIFTGDAVHELALVHQAFAEFPWVTSVGETVPVSAGTRYELAVGSAHGGPAGAIRLRLQMVTPPANDAFAGRVDLGHGEAAVEWSGVAATQEPDEPDGSSHSVWWTWTPTNSGPVAISVEAEPRPAEDRHFVGLRGPAAAVYTGNSLDTLELAGGRFDTATGLQSPMVVGRLEAVAGTPYVIVGIGQASPNSKLRLAIARTEAPEVQVVLPSEGASFPADRSVPVAGFALDADGSVSSMRFMAEESPEVFVELAVVQPPFRGLLGPLPPGHYELRARAQDNLGAKSDSPAVAFDVRPVNDWFTNSISVAGAPVSLTGVTHNASYEPGEPFASPGSGGSVWWSWVPTASGRHTVSLKPVDGGPALFRLFTGSTIETLSLVGESTTGPSPTVGEGRLKFDAAASETYRLATYGSQRSVEWNIQRGFPPLVMLTGPTNVNPVLAGQTVTFSADATDPDGEMVDRVEFFLGNEVVGVATNSPFEADYQVPDVPYAQFVQLFARAVDASGLSTFSEPAWFQTSPPPPLHDNFAARLAFSGSVTSVLGPTDFATTEPEEPPGVGRSVWWSWTAPAAGAVAIRAERTDGSNSHPRFAIYTGDSLANLTEVANSWVSPSPDPTTPTQLTFVAEAAKAYHLAVAGPGVVRLFVTQTKSPTVTLVSPTNGVHFTLPVDILLEAGSSDEDGQVERVDFFHQGAGLQIGSRLVGTATQAPFVVTLSATNPALASAFSPGFVWARATDNLGVFAYSEPAAVHIRLPAPANDLFANRMLLTGDFVVQSMSNGWATIEPGERNPPAGGSSVWFAWTPTSGGPATVQIDTRTPPLTSGGPPGLSIYQGTDLTNLILLAESVGGFSPIPSPPLQARFNVDAGMTYLIAVYPDPLDAMPDILRLAVSEPPSVVLVAPAEGTRFLSGDPVTITAEALDPGGLITSVSFLAPQWAGSLSHTDSEAPFSLTMPAVHTPASSIQGIRVTALAVDNQGLASLSSPVTIFADPRPPANDLFANRTGLAGPLLTFEALLEAAATEPNEMVPLGGEAGSVWWSWTPEMSGRVTVRLANGPSPKALGIYRGADVSNLATLAQRVETSSFGGMYVTALVEGGAEYVIGLHFPRQSVGASELRLLLDGCELTQSARTAEGHFQFEFRTTWDRTWIVEMSTDLIIWSEAATTASVNGRFSFQEPGVNQAPQRFFRVKESPWFP